MAPDPRGTRLIIGKLEGVEIGMHFTSARNNTFPLILRIKRTESRDSEPWRRTHSIRAQFCRHPGDDNKKGMPRSAFLGRGGQIRERVLGKINTSIKMGRGRTRAAWVASIGRRPTQTNHDTSLEAFFVVVSIVLRSD